MVTLLLATAEQTSRVQQIGSAPTPCPLKHCQRALITGFWREGVLMFQWTLLSQSPSLLPKRRAATVMWKSQYFPLSLILPYTHANTTTFLFVNDSSCRVWMCVACVDVEQAIEGLLSNPGNSLKSGCVYGGCAVVTPSFNVGTSWIYSKTPGFVISVMRPAGVLIIIHLHCVACFDISWE